MKYKKKKPIKGGFGGCLHCGYQYEILPLQAVIAVGFGSASVTKNGKVVYDEQDINNDKRKKYWTVEIAEKEAKRDPDNDWQIHFYAPLSERHYQRQADNEWVLYKKGIGFA